ncbi:MAG: hypothetical protein C4K58_01125 [Flavobacteriaceae bacterium]|nr:MAG: hypothetical protein C4K58_01125 [Flavobacteriaceae bacterium]
MFGKKSNPPTPVSNFAPKPVSPSPSVSSSSHTIIGESVIIEGNLVCKGDLRVDGIINGNIKAAGRLVQGNKSIITGDIHCGSADLEGTTQGKILCQDLLSVKSTAVIKGEVLMSKLSVEPGAVFNVNCQINQGKTVTNLVESAAV